MPPRQENRRAHRRYRPPAGIEATIRFMYPDSNGDPSCVKVKDISPAGLSFILNQALPGLEVGSHLDDVEVRVGEHGFRGDLVVLHLTPTPHPGSVCGALFYPASDDDLLVFRALIYQLKEEIPFQLD